MTLAERLPHLTDTELATLAANASRLRIADNDPKRAEAAEGLWPQIEAEVATRREAKLATARAAKTAKAAKSGKPAKAAKTAKTAKAAKE